MCAAQHVQSTYIHADISGHRVHTEWHWPLSGVLYIMMEKSVLARDGGGPPFTISTITYKIVVYAPAVWADTNPISTLSLYGVFSFVKPLQTDSNYQYLIYGNPVRK
jgi:hypothetical protein